ASVKKIQRATLYATALGLYELSVNGKRVGDQYLTPGWTDYTKRVNYQTYDITDQVQQRSNVLAANLGDGWHGGYFGFTGKRALYGPNPRLLAQLQLDYADGTSETIVTDESWKAAHG